MAEIFISRMKVAAVPLLDPFGPVSLCNASQEQKSFWLICIMIFYHWLFVHHCIRAFIQLMKMKIAWLCDKGLHHFRLIVRIIWICSIDFIFIKWIDHRDRISAFILIENVKNENEYFANWFWSDNALATIGSGNHMKFWLIWMQCNILVSQSIQSTTWWCINGIGIALFAISIDIISSYCYDSFFIFSFFFFFLHRAGSSFWCMTKWLVETVVFAKYNK